MKKILLFLILANISCQTGLKYNPDSLDLYKVSKIDSVNNYYIIYALKKDSLFKLVSKKESNMKCNKIRKNFTYKFVLHSISKTSININGLDMVPMNNIDINCYQFDQNTKICKETGIIDIYIVENLKGLCLN